ncbi:MAG: Rid family hydrolase [Pseudomonadota bacterium]
MTVRYLNPDGHPLPAGRYSHVAIAEPGRLAFIAGQVAVDAEGSLQAPGSVEGQMPIVFRNLGNVLAKIGASFADVLELTTYLVGEDSRQPWMDARGAVYAEHYGDGPYPPNTLLIISGLAHPDMKVEISAIVRLPD